MSKKVYIIYDARAYSTGPEDAAVLCTAQSLKEARRDVREMFPGSAIFEYDERPNATPGEPDELLNGKLVE